MPVDRDSALSAATRIQEGLDRRYNGEYLTNDIARDAMMVANYLRAVPTEAGPVVEINPSNPITPEFLRMIGFANPSTNGNVWTIQDADGCEFKYLFVGDNEFSDPEIGLLDNDSDGVSRRSSLDTEDDMIQLCRLLNFPIQLPA